MFSGKLLISALKKIHFRSAQVVHYTYGTTYAELLSTNNDVLRHLHFLVTEGFKSTVYVELF